MTRKPSIHELNERLESLSKEDELADRLREIELDNAERRGWRRGVRHVHKFCVTLGLSISAFAYNAGHWLYEHYLPVRAGVDTMIAHILRGDR